jgi:two-component system OmpR family response regulator
MATPTEAPVGGRVVIIDDDRSLLRLLRLIFEGSGFAVRTFQDATMALSDLDQDGADLIILDLEMPIMNGREFYKTLRGKGNGTPVLILSAYGARNAQLELGAEGSLAKPFEPDDLVEAANRLITS